MKPKINKLISKSGIVETTFMNDKIILGYAKKNKQIVYGARSIKKQSPTFARNTVDYDIFSNNPKKAAMEVQKLLDKNAGFDFYYAKPAQHPGTWKIKSKGNDMKKNTIDDVGIADYTKPETKVPFKTIDGIRYRNLKQELIRKQKTVKDPEFAFRHKKDQDDINRIKGFLKVKRLLK